MPSKSIKPPRCKAHNVSSPCPKCKRETTEVGHMSGHIETTRGVPLDFKSFAQDRAFDPPTTTSSSDEKTVQVTTRQATTAHNSYPTYPSGKTSSGAATRGATRSNSPVAQRPTTDSRCALPTRERRQVTTRTKTHEQATEYLRALSMQSRKPICRIEEAEDEDDSSGDESDDDDDDDDEDEDDTE